MIPKGSLQAQAYSTIKELILTHSLDTEILYSETQMAKNMGISRTPLREALQCLSQDGYIEIIPSRGFRIRTLNKKNAQMITEARCAIEGFCIHSIVASRESDPVRFQKLLQELKRSISSMTTHAMATQTHSEHSLDNFSEDDYQFHLLIVHYLHNQEFDIMYQRLMYMIHLNTSAVLTIPGHLEHIIAEHKEILSLIQDGNSDEAYKALMNHLMTPLDISFAEKNTLESDTL